MKRIAFLVATVFGFGSLGLTPALAVDERIIDIVSVSWSGSAPLPATVDQLAVIVDTEVNPSWKTFTTLVGDTKERTVSFIAGKTLTEPILINAKMPCSGIASTEFMNSMRIEAYKRLGIADDSKRYLIIASPKAGCIWSGRAPLGTSKSRSGTLVLHDSDAGFVIAHELGHTFGLGHTNFLRCDNGKDDGAWSDTCKAVEYGGTIDVMGNVATDSPLSTYHQWRIGLLDDSQVKQVWQSETLILAPSDFANGLRAIYMRDGNSAYWIEYRRTLTGVGYKPGLVIFRIDPPPIASVVSPNPEDAAASEFGQGLSADLWMLNLDTYRYLDSRSNGGSMSALTATTFSGNISFSATPTESSATVVITRKADVTAPPTPELIPVSDWRYPGIEIIRAGYVDAETAIASFQASMDGVISDLPVTGADNWHPTYLNPFSAPKTVHVRDLPEGAYSFALRAIDIAGNKSAWSQAMKVTIDRARPVVTNDFILSAINADQISLAWTGAKDAGIGLCQTNLVNEDGLIVQSSRAKSAPVITLTKGVTLKASAQIFDCIGNGVSGDLSITNTLMPVNNSSRTGKWLSAGSAYGAGALKCAGKCTASFSAVGRFDVLVGAGNSTVSTGTRTLATISDSKVAKFRVGATIDIGTVKKVVRITGSNFVLIGLASVATTFTNPKDLNRLPAPSDSSLVDAKQLALAKFGFNAEDFSQEWTVLPMGGGTSLDDPSLDLCSGTFPSESERIERRQVAATKVGTAFSFLSTEVVKYSSATAAQSARKELVKTVEQCQKEMGFTDTTGTLVPYLFSEIKNLPNGLVADTSRVMVRAQIDSGVRARQLLGFYQFSGEMFTGLYVMTSGQSSFTDAQVATWLQVAVTMAERMKSKTP